MSALSEYLGANLRGRSGDDIVTQAEREGHSIHRSAVYAALEGQHAKRPREATLAALAAGFGLDVRKLRELAGKPPGELGPWVPTDESASLTRDQRKALDELIRTIVKEDETNAKPAAGKKSPDVGTPASDDDVLSGSLPELGESSTTTEPNQPPAKGRPRRPRG